MLENDIRAQFAGQPFEIVAINSHHEASGAGVDVQRHGLRFPMAFDFDSELFRRYRLPDHVFPLNVVIDREGKVVLATASLDEAVEAVARALGE